MVSRENKKEDSKVVEVDFSQGKGGELENIELLSERPDYQIVVTNDKDNEIITYLSNESDNEEINLENQDKLNFLVSVSNAYNSNHHNHEMSKNFKLGLLYDNIGLSVERGILSKLGMLSGMNLVDGADVVENIIKRGDLVILDVLYRQGLSLLNMLNNIEFREIRNYYFNGQATDNDLVHVNQLYKGFLAQYLENKYLTIVGQSTGLHQLDFTESELTVLDKFLFKLCEFLLEPALSTTGYPVDLEKDVVEILHKHFN